MAQSNDSVAITPGSGATIATHNPGDGKEYQVVIKADADGNLEGSLPRYRLIIPAQAVGANKVFADLFNASGSGKKLRILSAFAFVALDAAVTGTLGIRLSLTRTTAVGTGGTAATADGTDPVAPVLSKLDTANAALPAGVTARSAPTGGATASAVLATRFTFTEETNAGTAVSAALGLEFVRNIGAKVIVREGEGLRFLQGTVASVGNVSFEITFETF